MDFQFLQNPISRKWVILAPRRAKRPDVAKGTEPVCPFCPGKEGQEEELYRVKGTKGTKSTTGTKGDLSTLDTLDTLDTFDTLDSDWLVRVLPNKFPFAPIHELVIHAPQHGLNFDQLPQEHVELILQTYKKRYLLHQDKGQVYVFHNRGEAGGESLPHAHTQIAVVPFEVKMDIPRLDPTAGVNLGPKPSGVVSTDLNLQREKTQNSTPNNAEEIPHLNPPPFQKGEEAGGGSFSVVPRIVQRSSALDEEHIESVETSCFYLFCPHTSQWPDEVWVAPKKRGRAFGEITDEEISDLAFILPRLIKILDLRHGATPLPFNFHIYPGGDWYLRLVPRIKTLGGFEVGTGIYINTQDPTETIKFIKEHFENPDEEKIKAAHQAKYGRHA